MDLGWCAKFNRAIGDLIPGIELVLRHDLFQILHVLVRGFRGGRADKEDLASVQGVQCLTDLVIRFDFLSVDWINLFGKANTSRASRLLHPA